MSPEISVTQVQAERSRREQEEAPVITLSARVVVSSVADIRVTARPVVATMADVLEVPRLEVHTVDGTSVGIGGRALPAILRDSLGFLRGSPEASKTHAVDGGLSASFDLSTGPFTVLEQPPFRVAGAVTHIHPSGNVALRLHGKDRARKHASFHEPVPEGETERPRPAFELQLTARRAVWLMNLLEESLAGLGAGIGEN